MRHAPVFLGRHTPNTPEWHALRATGIGASEIAAVLGLSPWLSPFSLWHLKAGTVDDGFVGNAATYWGATLEPVVAREYRRRNHRSVKLQPGTYGSREHRWQLVNPDGIIGTVRQGQELLEVKTARYADGWGDEGTDVVPLHYRCQVMHALDVMGLDVATIAVLIGGSDYREYRIEFDEAEAAILRDAGAAFWQTVLDGTPPSVDAASSTTATLRALHPDVVDVEVEVPDDLAAEFVSANAHAKAADERKAAATNALRAAMGDARVAVAGGVKVATRSVSTPRRFDRDALALEHPDLVERFTVTGEPVHRITPTRGATA